MLDNPLNIVSVDAKQPQSSSNNSTSKNGRRQEAQAKFERLWRIDPEQFNPLRDSMGKERLERTWKLIQEMMNVEDKQIVDLGCGGGVFSRRLAKEGAHVHAVDISSLALQLIQKECPSNITVSQDYLPRTLLNDSEYDLVISTDLIAYLPTDEHRLYFSELGRLVKADGYTICSTPLDINSEDSLERFASLAETEFTPLKWVLSYHLFYIRILDFLKAPQRFAQAGKDKEYRHQSINERRGITKWWFRVNSNAFLSSIWSLISYMTKPIYQAFSKSSVLLISCEKVCKFFWGESGVSHAIFIGKRRPLVTHVPEDAQPQEIKHKKQVWE